MALSFYLNLPSCVWASDLFVMLIRGAKHVKCQVPQLGTVHVHVDDSCNACWKRDPLSNYHEHRKGPEIYMVD